MNVRFYTFTIICFYFTLFFASERLFETEKMQQVSDRTLDLVCTLCDLKTDG